MIFKLTLLFQAAMATSLDVRTYVLMSDDASNANSVSLELVDLQFHHTWSLAELDTLLGEYMRFCVVSDTTGHCEVHENTFDNLKQIFRSAKWFT